MVPRCGRITADRSRNATAKRPPRYSQQYIFTWCRMRALPATNNRQERNRELLSTPLRIFIYASIFICVLFVVCVYATCALM